MPFPYEDLRSFLDDCDERGELIRVHEEVDWNLEVGAIARRLAELGAGRPVSKGGTPSVLFEKIKGFPPGFRIAANIMSNTTRVAMALGHKKPDESTITELGDMVVEASDNHIKPKLVKTAPCKQNKMIGDEVNLYRLPAPMVHDGDGGRYLCTMHCSVMKDPDGDWVNWGMYRAMIVDRRTMTGQIEPLRHGDWIVSKHEERGENTPFAIAIGPDPASLEACVTPAAFKESEQDIAGGIRHKPLEVVKCETNDLVVPANSEIVIEGFIPPKILAYEGPYGEYTGYRASPRDLRHVFVVKAITWRNDPILAMSCMGVPVDDAGMMQSISNSGIIKRRLLDAGLPIVGAHMPPEGGGLLVVVSTKTPSAGIAHLIKDVVFSVLPQKRYRSVFVVNDDVDITNPFDVFHAFFTRIHPTRSIFPSFEPSNALVPYGSLQERLTRTAPNVLYDGTWPTDWHPTIAVPPKSSFKTLYPQEIQERVLAKWHKYGFK